MNFSSIRVARERTMGMPDKVVKMYRAVGINYPLHAHEYECAKWILHYKIAGLHWKLKAGV